jgi:hypothetical protein
LGNQAADEQHDSNDNQLREEASTDLAAYALAVRLLEHEASLARTIPFGTHREMR